MATKTWVAAAAGAASVDANWSGGVKPVAGDDIVFDATSVQNCSWDLAITVGTLSLSTGYSGVVTQAASFGAYAAYFSAGTFTPSLTYTLTVTTNFVIGASGMVSIGNLRLIVTSDGAIVTNNSGTNLDMRTFTVNGNTTLSGSRLIDTQVACTVASGKTLTLNRVFSVIGLAINAFNNGGTINGSSTLYFEMLFGDVSPTALGTITCPVTITTRGDATANRIFSLSATTLLSSLLVKSDHPTYTCTLHHGSNYTLNVAGTFTLGDRGVMTQGTGPWSFATFLQNGASSLFTQGGDVGVTNNFTVSAGTYDGDGVHYTYVGGVINTTGGTVDGLFRIMKRIIARSSRSRRSVSRG
jgi:hypothetical protein